MKTAVSYTHLLVNKYMDLYQAHPDQLVYKARCEKYAKIISKTIILSGIDVYKRQAYHRLKSLQIVGGIAVQLHIGDVAGIGERMVGSLYGDLLIGGKDVYKRQP